MTTAIADENALALKLRQTYQYERGLYSYQCKRPTKYRIPACWDLGARDRKSKGGSVWHKLVRFCARRDIDPVRYIQWCLSMEILALAAPPEPNQLLAATRMESYLKNLPKQEQLVAVQIRTQKAAAERNVAYEREDDDTAEEAWAFVLSQRHSELSPLFRYCIAIMLGNRFSELADHFKQHALLQYHRHPTAYDRFWAPLIPKGIAEAAEQLYSVAINQDPYWFER